MQIYLRTVFWSEVLVGIHEYVEVALRCAHDLVFVRVPTPEAVNTFPVACTLKLIPTHGKLMLVACSLS